MGSVGARGGDQRKLLGGVGGPNGHELIVRPRGQAEPIQVPPAYPSLPPDSGVMVAAARGVWVLQGNVVKLPGLAGCALLAGPVLGARHGASVRRDRAGCGAAVAGELASGPFWLIR